MDAAPDDRTDRGPGVSALTPFVVSCHIHESMNFYRAIGFEVQSTYEPGGPGHVA